MQFLRYGFIAVFMLLLSLCSGMTNKSIYTSAQEQQAVLLYDHQLTLLSNQVTQFFSDIEKMNDQLSSMLSLKSLYACHKNGESSFAIDWYCGQFGHLGTDVIKNQGLLVYRALILFRECSAVLVHLEELAAGNPLLGVLCTIFQGSHAKLKSSIIQAYNHLDDYGKYSFACYFYELEPELFFGDCLATDEIISINLEFAAQAKHGFMNELNVSLSRQFLQ